MKELITLESFKQFDPKLKPDHKLLEISDNLAFPIYFVKEGLGFDDIQLHRFQSLTESEKVYLLESVTESNIEKAALVLEKSHEEIIVELRKTHGDIQKFRFFDTIESMIKDIQLSSPANQELLKANEIIQELIKHKQTYVQAFAKDNTYRKLVYNISALCAIFTIIKEHLMFLDITSSKNEADLVMVKDAHYYATDVNNIKFLNQSLALVKGKGINSPAANSFGPVNEGITSTLAKVGGYAALGLGAAAAASMGLGALGVGAAGAAVAGAAGAGAGVAGVTLAAGAAYYTFIKLGLYALGAIASLYLITRISAKPMINYLESYEYIKNIAKNSKQDSDKKIVETIDKMVSLKKKFMNMWKNDKSKNIKDYMKDLSKDVAVIQKYESNGNQNHSHINNHNSNTHNLHSQPHSHSLL